MNEEIYCSASSAYPAIRLNLPLPPNPPLSPHTVTADAPVVVAQQGQAAQCQASSLTSHVVAYLRNFVSGSVSSHNPHPSTYLATAATGPGEISYTNLFPKKPASLLTVNAPLGHIVASTKGPQWSDSG